VGKCAEQRRKETEVKKEIERVDGEGESGAAGKRRR
jgi:hypothetical protein